MRGIGDPVVRGSRNVGAEVEVAITARPGEGTLARLAALLERAEAERPRVQRQVDRVARVFAPAVLVAAAATALGWALTGHGVAEVALAASSVLIVACPCALGLATPAAVTAALGRAAAGGILFKSGEAFERCARVDTAVLDKTGTVSEGRLAVEDVVAAAGVDRAEILATAVAAEGASLHPVAEALRAAAGACAAPELEEPGSRKLVPGRGVAAGALRVGSRSFVEEVATPDASLVSAAERLARDGHSLAFVARGSRVLGVVALSDPPRADAREATQRLRALGLDLRVVSGDHADAVEHAARQLELDAFRAGVTPEEKVAEVRALQAAGRRVLVAGDGVNDAAALAAADVGIALARGVDVALHAADVVVRAPRLGAVADAVALSRTTLRRIRENLGFAVAYNLVAVPLAMAGVLGPLGAALAMSASSLLVTGNASRILRWKPPA